MRRSIKFTLLGWGLFGISFFLPSYKEPHFDGVGWECAVICFNVLKESGSGGFDFWYYGPFNLSNLIMAVMPILLLTVFRKKAVPLGIVIVQGILLLHVLSWPIMVLADVGGSIKIGYYVWLLSMMIIFGISMRREPKPVQEVG